MSQRSSSVYTAPPTRTIQIFRGKTVIADARRGVAVRAGGGVGEGEKKMDVYVAGAMEDALSVVEVSGDFCGGSVMTYWMFLCSGCGRKRYHACSCGVTTMR